MSEPYGPDDASEAFADEARRAGIVVPPRRRFGTEQIAVALGISVLLVAASLGVGYVLGWMEPARGSVSGPHLAGPQDCGINGSTVSLALGVDPNASTQLEAASVSLAEPMVNLTGPCLSLGFLPSGPEALATLAVDVAIGPALSPTGLPADLSSQVYSVPVLAAPLVVIYHLNGSATELNLTADALAGAYLGTLRTWNASLLTEGNPGLRSDLAVVPFYLAGPSAANALLSEYLSKENASFRSAVPAGESPAWPAGRAASSPSEMLSLLAATPGAIGYEPSDVCPSLASPLHCARVQSSDSSFVPADLPSVRAAVNVTSASSAAIHADWSNITGVAFGNSSVYPMVGLTYATVYRDLAKSYGSLVTPVQAKWLLTLLWWTASVETTLWATDHVVPVVENEGYVPMTTSIEATAQATLAHVTYNGTSILFPNGEESGETGNETGEF